MKASTKRIATVGMSVLLTFAMAPMQAFAASSVTVGGNSYDKASSGSGSAGGAWAWDGANGMTLDNYDGGSISAVGDLAIALTGDNKVDAGDEDYGITTIDGDLSITGDGNLDVKVDSDTSADGIFAENGDITISDTSVSVDATSDGRVSGVHAHNGDVNVEGSTVSVNTTSDSGTSSGIVGASGDVNVDNSNVTVSNSGAVNGYGIVTYGSSVDIIGSTVDVSNSAANLGYGISTFSGDVIANGSNVSVSSKATGENSIRNFGIIADSLDGRMGGEIFINKSNLTAATSGTSQIAVAIDAVNGSLTITDGSKIVATSAKQDKGISIGLRTGRSAKGVSGSDIIISSSDVTATGGSAGIIAGDQSGAYSPTIAIEDSNVTASGAIAAIMSTGTNASHTGAITISGSSIVSPAGARVLDFSDPMLNYYGQTIGFGNDPITWIVDPSGSGTINPAVATDVVIAKAQKPAAEPAANTATESTTKVTAQAASSSAIPKTGDETLPFALALASLLAAGGTLLLARREVVRKR